MKLKASISRGAACIEEQVQIRTFYVILRRRMLDPSLTKVRIDDDRRRLFGVI
jgi:hypothetical protein